MQNAETRDWQLEITMSSRNEKKTEDSMMSTVPCESYCKRIAEEYKLNKILQGDRTVRIYI